MAFAELSSIKVAEVIVISDGRMRNSVNLQSACCDPQTMESNKAVYFVTKRCLDIVFGILGCNILLPIAILVKIAYLLTGDTAPIIYSHKRIARYGKAFRMYKFRSMIPDADEMLLELLKDEANRHQWDENQKLDKDPRITTIGEFLRKSSLDEFPQFINVVKGDMSLVGPRPLAEGELEEHDGITIYNAVKPGITGWWACNGRSNVGYKERLDLEYYYVKNCSLRLDGLIICKTIMSVLSGDGAY